MPLPAAAFVRHPLCEVCVTWLASVAGNLATPQFSSGGPLLGAPGTRSRVRVFPDQCHLCKEMLGDAAVVVDSVVIGGGPGPFPGMLVCGACDTWIGGLADDGRSARGNAERAIDGQYGSWPHPNLRAIDVSLQVSDRGLDSTIRESCRRMGVEIRDTAGDNSVVFVEASTAGGAGEFLRADLARRTGRIILARLAAEADLKACLELGISTWLTNPVTPQQVSAALTVVARRPGYHQRWDAATALPAVDLEYLSRPALAVTPVEGVSPFEAAWLSRRVTRGYDEVGATNGVVIIVPRAPEADIARVEARISRALAGRCTVRVVDAHARLHRRLEAAG